MNEQPRRLEPDSPEMEAIQTLWQNLKSQLIEIAKKGLDTEVLSKAIVNIVGIKLQNPEKIKEFLDAWKE